MFAFVFYFYMLPVIITLVGNFLYNKGIYNNSVDPFVDRIETPAFLITALFPLLNMLCAGYYIGYYGTALIFSIFTKIFGKKEQQ